MWKETKKKTTTSKCKCNSLWYNVLANVQTQCFIFYQNKVTEKMGKRHNKVNNFNNLRLIRNNVIVFTRKHSITLFFFFSFYCILFCCCCILLSHNYFRVNFMSTFKLLKWYITYTCASIFFLFDTTRL